MRKLAFLLLLGGIAPKVFAPTIEILYQPVPDLNPIARHFGAQSWAKASDEVRRKVKEVVDIGGVGHVAIRLPPGTLEGGTVFGWQPIPSSRLPADHPMHKQPLNKVISWLQTKGPSGYPSIPGSFQVDDDWVKEVGGSQFEVVVGFPETVSDQDLKKIAENIKRVNIDRRFEYQMIPNGDAHAPFRMNCVTSVLEALKGTPVTLEVPRNGSLSTFVRLNQWRNPRRACFFEALVEEGDVAF